MSNRSTGGRQENGRMRDPDYIEVQIPIKAEVKMSKKKTKTRQLPSWTVKILDSEGEFLPIWKLIFLVSCVFSVSVDPLFFYLPVINEEKKCVAFDRRLHIISLCLRTVLDSISLVKIIFQFFCPYIDEKARLQDGVLVITERVLVTGAWPIAKRYLWSCSFAIDVLSILPIPQVLVPTIFKKMRGSNALNTRKMLNAVVLSQYVPRITRIYLSWRKVRKNTTISLITIAVKAGFNLFLYIVASHVLGAFWYFFSIQRETDCWHLACENYIGCNRTSLNCDHSSGNYTFLNDYCPVEKENPTVFDFGIFLEALQSGTVASMNFPRKFLYCFWWGLRNLSSLGQNLQTSPYFWENCFTVLISIFGLLLLLYFIGNLQWETQKQLETYMDKNDIAKMRGKEQSVELWIQRNKLPDPIKYQIMNHIKPRLQEKKNDIDAENPFPHLPISLRKRIKHHICLPMIKNVPMWFQEAISERQLQLDICEYIKQVYYCEDTYIIREGEPLDRMLFVTKDVVWKFATTNNNGVGSTVSSSRGECIEKGCYCGEEILNWGFHGFSQRIMPNLSDLPISDKTLKTHTKVEAFALMANDLKALVSRYAAEPTPTPNEAVLMIQEAWRRRNKVLNWQSRARNT
ncbi:cyclic nucleotide-gated ion channel 1-like [Juglans regia]|uniref:Cyclic nucleotide-gated ion channel 1-like n=1 Tax=Juglans regia TaxID=51240 RepID=A0A6P9EHC7_JUGRE|nr:cyclic nucleotide-gated ion channel 1-like [Juglans regia]